MNETERGICVVVGVVLIIIMLVSIVKTRRKILKIEQFCNDNNIPLEKLGDIGEISDGSHTFNSLYHQRLILFATLVNAFPHLSWKSRKHSDGVVPFGGGWFIVGIATPKGQYTYHYEDKDWDIFHCPEIESAPKWDGHTDKDVERLLSLCPYPSSSTDLDSAENEFTMDKTKLSHIFSDLPVKLPKGEIEAALISYDGDSSKPYCDLVYAGLRIIREFYRLKDENLEK